MFVGNWKLISCFTASVKYWFIYHQYIPTHIIKIVLFLIRHSCNTHSVSFFTRANSTISLKHDFCIWFYSDIKTTTAFCCALVMTAANQGAVAHSLRTALDAKSPKKGDRYSPISSFDPSSRMVSRRVLFIKFQNQAKGRIPIVLVHYSLT